jgi:hypothetical protein
VTNRVAGGNGGNGGNGGFGTYGGGNGANGGNGATGYGGAIYSSGTLEIADSLFQFNTAAGGAGGTRGVGGATGTNSMTTYPGIDGNGGTGAIGSGGAICAASCTVTGSTFDRNNSAGGNTADAGSQNSSGQSGQNGPDSYGGGLLVTGTGSMVNCTLSGNTANGGKGGAGGPGYSLGGNGGNGGSAWGGSLHVTGQSTLQNCTLAGGRANPGAAGAGGSATNYPGTAGQTGTGYGENIANSGLYVLTLKNSILAPPVSSTNINPNTYGILVDGGYNLSSDGTPVTLPLSRKYKNARLIALAYNGGLTPTMALQAGSPAIDVIPAELAPETDQRGIYRSSCGVACDIGAYEYTLPPSFNRQPDDLMLGAGATATFTVAVTGIPEPECHWIKGGTNLVIGQGTNLVLVNITTNDAGKYYVVASNAVGIATSRTATLSVLTPPSIVVDLTNTTVTVGVGDTVAFHVEASGTPTPTNQWYWNSNRIVGANGSTYSITNVAVTNAGIYWMTAYNSVGIASSRKVTLVVVANLLPYITQEPAFSLTVIGGQTASFTVSGGGVPSPSYHWSRRSTPVTPMPGFNTNTLDITNCWLPDAGAYRVVLSNIVGCATSQWANLIVQVPARILAQPVSLTTTQGGTVTFNVSVEGNPAPLCQWRFNSNNIVPGRFGTNLTLTVTNATQAGIYSVLVTNSLGWMVSSNAVLTISSGRPSAIIVKTTGTAFKIQCTNSVFGLNYILQYKPTPDSPEPWRQVFSAMGTGESIDLVDPNPLGTEGYYRLMVE